MTTKLMLTAALTIATGVASAETFKVEIPFAFQAGGKTMAAGTYMVNLNSTGYNRVSFANYDTRRSIILLPGYYTAPAKAWVAKGDPVLSFDCGVGRCALARLWTGSAEPAMTFPHPSLGRDVAASLTDIRLVKVNGD
jgi:hypothetical protein